MRIGEQRGVQLGRHTVVDSPMALLILIALFILSVVTATSCTTVRPGDGQPSPTQASPAPASATQAPTTQPSPTSSPMPAAPPAANPSDAAQRYLSSWASGKYDQMYALLSKAAKSRVTWEKFEGRYRAITEGAGITAVMPSPEAPATTTERGARTVDVPFTVKIRTITLGEFTERNVLPLVAEDGEWRVDWTPSLIFRDLTADTVVRLLSDEPVRGNILDRKGRPLAQQGQILSIGVVPGAIKDEPKAVAALSEYLGLSKESIKARYASSQPDWWVPLRDVPMASGPEAKAKLDGIAGVEVRAKESRVYPYGPLAAHTIGYISRVTADDVKTLAAKGYEEGDFVGRTGIEASAEEALAGSKGGRLAIMDGDGSTVRLIARRQSQQGQDVHLSLDLDLQRKAEDILGDKVGSLVLMDARDNSILALVSHPGFDPNLFVTGLSDEAWQKLSNDPKRPFQNRPLLSAYPTGSIFKVVTMAAGLEAGGFRAGSEFFSNGSWQLPGTNQVFRDWVPQGHGKLDLVDGLAQSCNIVFYEIGYKLDSTDATVLPKFARDFGLGQPTGIAGLPEAAGTVPDPDWKRRTNGQAWYPGDGVNLSIGQGYFEATPLQMANLYASLANGGTLRTPLLIKRIGDGPAAKEYAAQDRFKLPISTANLAVIREGMRRAASDPKGTAYYAFRGFSVPTAAKTGSAENQGPEAHAWFAGFAPASAPEVVVLAMVEGGRAGGEVAAPLGRQMFEAYFARR